MKNYQKVSVPSAEQRVESFIIHCNIHVFHAA